MTFLPHSEVAGPADAPWVVLSNSLGSNLHMWDDQMEVLTASHRVLRYDARGHGKSASPPGPYSFDDLVGDVLAVMDAHGIETAQFIGLSKGGMTGMGLAIHHPERFSQMILCDCRADAPDFYVDMWTERIARVRAGGLDAIADAALEMWLNAEFRATHPEKVAEIRKMIVSNDPAGYVACCEALKTLDYLRQLPEVGVPITYVGGSADQAAMPEVMRAMAAATPGARYIEILDGHHLPNIDSASAFNAILRETLLR